MRGTTRRVALALALTGLFATACGSRVSDGLRQRAADAALGVGGAPGGGTAASGAGGTAGGTAGAADSTGGPTATGQRGAGGGSAGSVAGRGGKGGGAGTVQAGRGGGGGRTGARSSTPRGGNGGATDVGVTATTISVGTVADLSGPVPGIFSGAVTGAQAYANYVNSRGGVEGRALKIVPADSQTDCNANQNATRSLLPKVFAFVGSFSLYQDCGTKVLRANRGVSDISYPLGPDTKANPTNFPPQAAPLGYQNGMFRYWAGRYGGKVKKVGSLYANIPSAVASQKAAEKAAGTAGWKFVYSRSTGATQTTFQAEILQMKRAGVQLVYIIAQNAANAAEIKKEADQQGFKPVWVIPIAYASDFLKLVGDPAAAEGIVGANLFSLFFTRSEAAAIPEVALYQQWMRRTDPNAAMDLYSMYAWASAKLFVQALQAAGPRATRAGLMAQLRKTTSFGGQIIAPTNPAGKKPGNCYVVWVIKGGVYQRQDTPGRYRCDGTFVPYGG